MWLAVARPAPAKNKPVLVEKWKMEMLRFSIYLINYACKFILSSCSRMKSCKTNLVICFRKLDDSLRSIDTSPTDEDTRKKGKWRIFFFIFQLDMVVKGLKF